MKHIIRGKYSGVSYGEIVSRSGEEVELKNVRRIWYWDGAFTLFQMAKEGVKKPENCKFSCVIESSTVLDACEIIPCTEVAEKNLDEVKEWVV